MVISKRPKSVGLALVNSDGHGLPVPVDVELEVIRYIIGKRIEAVRADNSLLTWERWNHSKVFYESRTWLNHHNWDTSIYNDTSDGGKKRKKFYDKIRPACENFYDVKRHEIGIFPNDRATMTFGGDEYSVSYHTIPQLCSNGTDIVFVEKQSTVTLMSPYAEPVGISFIDSEGFGSEYGVALARLCDLQEGALDYTEYKNENGEIYCKFPQHRGNLANITDCDVSGVGIGIKINGSTRLGLDLWTIDEINQAPGNPGLDLRVEDLQETIDTKNNSHYQGLLGILHNDNKGKFNKSLDVEKRQDYIQLLTRWFQVNGKDMRYIDWLKYYRIELDTVLAAAGPKAFWNWLKWKLEKVWPNRNYNRAMFFDSYLYTPTMTKFIEWYQRQSGEVIKDELSHKQKNLENVEGFYDNVNDEQEKVKKDIIDNTMLPNKRIKKVDLALKAIMDGEN